MILTYQTAFYLRILYLGFKDFDKCFMENTGGYQDDAYEQGGC